MTTTTTTTTELPVTTSANVDVDEEDEDETDDEDDDYRRPESRTISNNWPDRIDPIPTFWPTQNWWGTIDPMRHDPGGGGEVGRSGGGQSRQSNRIPTNAPTPRSSNNNNNRNRADAGTNQIARSSSSSRRPSTSPYFQLLLAGLVQVRWLMPYWATSIQPSLRHRPLLATVSVIVAAASLFQIFAWSTSHIPDI